ncbi:MAG: endopeptidase La, partial [Desulfobulbaceae bacterium]|nr:endopeptidase La [Desulfobulbaceae bacterium]
MVMEKTTSQYPMMPLRDIVLFPHMVAPLVVGREKSIRALEGAMEEGAGIFLVTQRDAGTDDPDEDGVYEVGTVATVLQLLPLPDGTIKALVEGKSRARIDSFLDADDFFRVEVVDLSADDAGGAEAVAYLREVKIVFGEFAERNKKIPKEVVKSLLSIDDPAKFIDVLASHLPVKTEEKQQLLSIPPLFERMDLALTLLHREKEITVIEDRIRRRVKKKMEKAQKDYYLTEQMRAIQNEMGGGQEDPASEMAELEEQVKAKQLPEAATVKVEKELKKLKMMPPMSAEATVVRNYIDTILSLPWGEKTDGKIDIGEAENILDKDHFGLQKPKERILEYLAVQAQVKKIKGPILCLVGPPGVGKTSLCKSVARAMGRKFVRLSLGGVRDEAEIRGHRRTYIGALPGKIIQSLQKAKVNNPVFCLDEVDKMSTDFRGDPSSALLEVLDPEQNDAFNDHYLDIDYDLSDIFFITTANNLPSIPLPLQDRMEVIKLEGYTEEDKLRIALDYLIPKQLQENGFAEGDIAFQDRAIFEMIRRYTREAGVRNLERNIAAICRKVAHERLKKGTNKKFRISAQGIARYLG